MKRHTRAEIRAILSLRSREHLSYQALSDRTGIPMSTLAWWSQRERRQCFVEVEAVGEASDEGAGAPIELVLATGVHLRLRRGFDTAVLREVLGVLGHPC